MVKAPHVLTTWTFKRRFVWAKRVGFAAVSKTMAGMGRLKRIYKHKFRAARAVQGTSPSDMLGSQGADFLRSAAFWTIRSSGFLRWFCVSGAALRMTWPNFSWQGQYFTEMGWKIANRVGTRLSAQHSTFHFWRMSCRIASFSCCAVLKLRKSRRKASFFSFQLPTFKDLSQNSFVFKLALR